LEHFHNLSNNPDFKLSCIIAYYPTRIPDPNARFPGGVQVLVHLAGDEVRVVKQSQLVGIQGKKRVTRKKIDQGLGVGGTQQKMAWPTYSYDADPGFAEHDMDEYDKVSAEMAWTRSIAAARRAFRWDAKHEGVVETNLHGKTRLILCVN
jgi:dienelactone hydrolase